MNETLPRLDFSVLRDQQDIVEGEGHRNSTFFEGTLIDLGLLSELFQSLLELAWLRNS